MFDTTEIADRIFRISMWEEEDMLKAGICFRGASYNLFLIKADRPVLIQTMFRRTFKRFRGEVEKIVPVSSLAYIVVPHHIGDSSGALSGWMEAAPRAEVVCSPTCASSSLKDQLEAEPRAVKDGDALDLGSHRLRFILTPWVDQWDSLMSFEERTGTLFPNDLGSTFGRATTVREDYSDKVIKDAAAVGYLPNDRTSLLAAVEKIRALPGLKVMAPMHGPTLLSHAAEAIEAFGTRPVYPAP